MTSFSLYPPKWSIYLILGVCYVAICWLCITSGKEVQETNVLQSVDEVQTAFQGNDWVHWEDVNGKIMARQVHPLLSYKNFPAEQVVQGDRLRKINYHELYQAEAVDRISHSQAPGKTLIYQVERPSPQGGSQVQNLQVINGFRLAYSFNDHSFYWRAGVWFVGIGTLVAFVILLILFPFLRKNWRPFLPLMLVVVSGVSVFGMQLVHDLYLIIESDLIQTTFEKGFTWVYSVWVMGYATAFLYFRAPRYKAVVLGLSGLVMLFATYQFFQIIFVDDVLRGYHLLIEQFCVSFFLIHLLAAIPLSIMGEKREIRWANHAPALVIGVLGLLFLVLMHMRPMAMHEHVLIGWQVLLFFPLVNSASSQIRFGKVNVVITKSLQYVIFFALCLFLYAVIRQVYEYLLATNPYRQLLEVITLILTILLVRALYMGNEQKFSAYFTTSQQQKYAQIKAFIATIPQFTSADGLREAITEELDVYFDAERVDIWWQEEVPEAAAYAHLYQQLVHTSAVWSRNKELSDFQFDGKWEGYCNESAYSLIAPITLTGTDFGLLLLGKKKRRVYNLSDLELLSQLLQQTQLTLNVLQLLGRERELLQKTFEANLTALRSQINPHFLFNTLNTISALIHDSPDLAEEAVEKLAFIFRYTLKFSSQNLVSLENELQLVSTYLEIEKIRFGSRLTVEIEMEPAVKDVELPAFVIQTLVENCIKHGIAKIIGRGVVSIDAYLEEDFMVCEVYDNGPGIDADRINKGTGLNNIITRLERMYDSKDLLVFENTGNGTRVRLQIPVH